MTVQRYEPFRCEDWEMEEDVHGDYVKYEDYESLVEDYQKLCDMIRSLYLETP